MAGRVLGCFGFGGLSGVAASALDTSYNQLTVSKTRTAADHRPRPQNISYLPVPVRLEPPHRYVQVVTSLADRVIVQERIDSYVVYYYATMRNIDSTTISAIDTLINMMVLKVLIYW